VMQTHTHAPVASNAGRRPEVSISEASSSRSGEILPHTLFVHYALLLPDHPTGPRSPASKRDQAGFGGPEAGTNLQRPEIPAAALAESPGRADHPQVVQRIRIRWIQTRRLLELPRGFVDAPFLCRMVAML